MSNKKEPKSKKRNPNLKEVAYNLYAQGAHTLETIADIVGVTPRTITNWKDNGKWQERMIAENLTQSRILAGINEAILSLIENSGGLVANAKEVTRLQKLRKEFTSGFPLETYMTIFMEFNKHLQTEGHLDIAQQFNRYQTSFLQSKIKLS
jgi:transposase-like protein